MRRLDLPATVAQYFAGILREPRTFSEMPEAAEPADLNLFELISSGHAPTLARICLEYWRDREPDRVLRLVVTRRFLARFPEVFDGFANLPGSTVRWTAFSEEDEGGLREALEYASGLIERPEGYNATTVLWSLVEKYCRLLPARHHLLMNLDDLLHQVAAHRPLAADFSATLFLPGFAYLDDDGAASRRRRVFVTMQAAMLRDRVLTHPQLRTLFVLDDRASELLRGAPKPVVFLPDPSADRVSLVPAAERDSIRRRLGVPDDGRRLYLFFGDMAARKGLSRVFRALAELRPEERRSIRLAIVGLAEPAMETRIAGEIAEARAGGDIDILRIPEYVAAADRDAWFDAADVALAPYLRHAGSSGVLMLAASHGVPVISQRFGQMGRWVAEHRLGLSVDPNDTAAFAEALRQCLSGPPAGYGRESGFAFARQRSPARFGEALFGALRPYYSGNRVTSGEQDRKETAS